LHAPAHRVTISIILNSDRSQSWQASRLRRPRPDQRQVDRGGARRGDGRAVDQGDDRPEDIAALAVFLASDAAKSTGGQVLPIDNDRQRA